jgi:hypothetical protein
MAWRENAHIGRLKVNKLLTGSAGQWKEAPSAKELASLRSDYTFATFPHPPILQLSTGAAPANTDTGVIRMLCNGVYFEKTNIGTQTLFMPTLAAGGIDVAGDQEANDGFAITQGITANDKHAYKVGTDGAFFARIKFSLADVSGTDDCSFGFRKAEAHQAAVDNYDEMASLNVISGDIKIETILNNGATVVTDTTDNWADNETHELEVRVSAAGVVTYRIDNKLPTTTAAFTFDADEVVVPFFQFIHDTDLCDTIILKEWEVGYQ